MQPHSNIADFKVIGINYKKTDASVRGEYALNNEQYQKVLALASERHLNELFILSTCNRTEIYGFAEHVNELAELVCAEAKGDMDTFTKLAYSKSGKNAVAHLFKVSAGLDSQILGDYEILGQIKAAVKFAKEQGFVGAFSERLVNSVIQASKAVKTNTALSGGTVSVSFAAVQYIKERVKNAGDKKILLLGTGKIGRNTCKNLTDYLHTKNITLINRTEEKAQRLAEELGLHYAPLAELDAQIAAADIILISTNAKQPIVLRSQLEGRGDKLIIDLSVPCNVETEATELPGITLVGVDELSKIKDETLQKRSEEVPEATRIINEHLLEFIAWYDMRKHVPMLREVKNKLEQLDTTISKEETGSPEKIQKVINTLAVKMRQQNIVGCHYIEAINDFIA